MKLVETNQFICKGTSQLLLLGVISKNKGLSGYQIIKLIKEQSDNKISLKVGSIYPQLDQLEKMNLITRDIESVSESTHMQKAIYSITKAGIQELQKMNEIWFEFTNTINKLLLRDYYYV